MNQQQIIAKFIKKIDSSFVDFDRTRLKDPLVGFSLRGYYPDWLLKKLRIHDNKNYIPFLYIYLSDEVTRFDELKIDKIPLIIKIDFLLKDEEYHNGEVAYVFNNKYVGNKLFLPISFHSNDEFYYDTKKGKLFKYCNPTQEVGLGEIYDQVMKLHIAFYLNPVGFKARTRIFFKNQFPLMIINLVALVLGILHWFIVGTLYTYDPIMAQLTNDLADETKRPNENSVKEEIDFFGYKVRIWTIGSYSFLMIFTFLIWHFTGNSIPTTLKIILSNNFSAILFAILTIIIYDSILPLILKYLVKGLKEFNINKKFREIKLSI